MTRYISTYYIEKAEDHTTHVERWYTQDGSTRDSDYSYEYIKMNQQRVRRLLKKNRWRPEELDALPPVSFPIHWLVITAFWCGDAANSIPYMIQMASHVKKLEISFIQRDRYPDLIDNFLTNGSRSIPKVIAYEPQYGSILGLWGPRPKLLQQKVRHWKEDESLNPADIGKVIQKWYVKDKGHTLKQELSAFLQTCIDQINPDR